jgi:mono/diheme cytochrome c family protein
MSSLIRSTTLLSCAIAVVLAFWPLASADAGPNAKKGAALYKQNCVVCHGPKGAGDGPAAKGLQPKPGKLNDKKLMSKRSDRHIFTIIKKGGVAVKRSPVMPPFPHLKKSQVQDLVAHVRKLCNCKENKKQARLPK